jgi:peptide-methionine (S)-S-oxide reductase
MKKFLLLFALLGGLANVSCQNAFEKNKAEELEKQKNTRPVQVHEENGLKKAYFASGCFWCVEAIYESVYGVKEAISGYSGGHTKNPTYESTNTGTTGHAETVEVVYNPKKVSFSTLVDVYFASQNITQVNGQGPDIGSQYRSILFYQNDEEKKIIESKINVINQTLENKKVAAQVFPFEKFWIAEAYHQNFKRNNPTHPYILKVSIPRLKNFKSKMPEVLKENN